jgi:hypothetical protein
MRIESALTASFLALGSAAWVVTGCAPDSGTSGSEEILATEDVGGAIDVELSTEEDQRGPRWVESGLVLPPGFPAELPVPAGASVVDQGINGDGKSYVVLGTPVPVSSLAANWVALLEAEGWSVQRLGGGSELRATLEESTVTATVMPAGSGSQLRIDY